SVLSSFSVLPLVLASVVRTMSLCASGRPQRGLVFFFFFQAEDGIRDRNVTGVQTCALPICGFVQTGAITKSAYKEITGTDYDQRSEERRVGKECRCRWAADHERKKD